MSQLNHFLLLLQVRHGQFEVIHQQGFALNEVEIQIKLRPVL